MKKTGKIVLIILLLGLGTGAGTVYHFLLRPNTVVADKGILLIRPGDAFETVLEALQSRGYVRNTATLRRAAALKNYPAHVKPGRYRIRHGMNNNQLVNLLRSGKQEPVHFVFNNVRTLQDFAGTVSRQLAMDSAEFLALSRDTAWIEQLGFAPENFMGMFIPNTYQLYWDIQPKAFVRRMYAEYRRFWTAERLSKAQKTGFSPMDVIILASIVEEETNLASEYPVIAGVYINRLKKGWKMEACPTLKFAWKDFTIKRVLSKHKKIDSPYNTYVFSGLPPGPVRMPSIRVIDAVLDYTRHDYMFFCAKSDFSGSHYFSRTLKQHNQYAAAYHRALNQHKIY